MGAFNVGVVPANVALDTATTSIAVVEFIDDWQTRNRSRRDALRDVIAVRTEPAQLAQGDIVSAVCEIAASLGPDARVIVNVAGSRAMLYPWRDAWSRGELANPPRTLTIAGDGLGTDEMLGVWRVGEAELVQSLREQVKTGAFTLPPEGEGADVLASAMAIEPGLTDAGRLRFPSRHRDGRVFALAMALYPNFHPSHGGRRYRTQHIPAEGRAMTFESFAHARAKLGALAEG